MEIFSAGMDCFFHRKEGGLKSTPVGFYCVPADILLDRKVIRQEDCMCMEKSVGFAGSSSHKENLIRLQVYH